MTNCPERRKYPASALLILLLNGTTAPALATEASDGLWTVFTSTDALHSDAANSRWHYWFDAQARYFDLGTGTNQYLPRPALGYKVRDGLSLWAGYARSRARSRNGTIIDEDRYWQQISWAAGRWNSGTLTMRARLVQRSVSSGDDLGVVLPVLAKYVRPLGVDRKRYFLVGLEPFVDLRDTDWSGDAGLGQNRVSLGVGWRIDEKFAFEAGYMNQYIWVDNGEDRVNHLGVLNFKKTF